MFTYRKPSKNLNVIFGLFIVMEQVTAFWDMGTTTKSPEEPPEWGPRQSFFKWPPVEFEFIKSFTKTWDWESIDFRRELCVVAGLSIDMIPLGSGTILNRRVVITSANFLEPYMHRQKDVRIWALGREGRHNTPYRYRVWRIRRVLPRSNNPEHWHGPRGIHVPRHDIALVHSWDQIYIYATRPNKFHYAYRSFLTDKRTHLSDKMHFAGSGFEDLTHIRENYHMFYGVVYKEDVVDCSIYLPKWWGKFICIKNINNWAGVPNGGGLFSNETIVGLGCFEIRYNEERILTFTDLRYYVDWIYIMANYTPGEYYEYAYPQWSSKLFWIYDGKGNAPYIPSWQIMDDLFPLGRK